MIPEIVLDHFPEISEAKWDKMPEWVQEWTVRLAQAEHEEIEQDARQWVRNVWIRQINSN